MLLYFNFIYFHTRNIKFFFRSEVGKLKNFKEENIGCNIPTSAKSSEDHCLESSPHPSSKHSIVEDSLIMLDKTSYENVFQDIVSMKTMLVKLKNLLSEVSLDIDNEVQCII